MSKRWTYGEVQAYPTVWGPDNEVTIAYELRVGDEGKLSTSGCFAQFLDALGEEGWVLDIAIPQQFARPSHFPVHELYGAERRCWIVRRRSSADAVGVEAA